MNAAHDTLSTTARSAGRTNHFAVDGVHLSAAHCADATVVVATGELDARNMHHLMTYARRWVSGGRPLVVDLSQLEFLAAQGIRTLFDLDDECRRNKVDWAVLPSHPVTRLLRICDKDGRLPVATSIDVALERFSASAPRLLQLVPKSG
ncbi:MAG TPA: STAS domain-containing protein [Mycobacterium sp.]|jgi:anti-anti-sigma factor